MIRLPTSLVIACLLIVAPALALAPALADDDCAVPMSEWQPRDAVMHLAETKGWAVSRIRLDDGCYEVTGRDADGRWIEVKLDPATLSIIEMEFEGHGHGGGSHDENED
jgi:hypothetical protein